LVADLIIGPTLLEFRVLKVSLWSQKKLVEMSLLTTSKLLTVSSV